MVDSDRNRIQTACLVVLAAGTIAAGLYLLRGVLIPFVLAVFLMYCLDPVIHLLVRRLRLPWLVAFVATVLLCIGVVLVCGVMVTAAIQDMAKHVWDYQSALERFVKTAIESLPLKRAGIDQTTLEADLSKLVRSGATGLLGQTLLGAMSVTTNATLIFVFTSFMLAGRSRLVRGKTDVWFEIERRAQRYILSLFLLSVVTGALVGASLALLGVPFAWMFGFLAFALNFIPNIGAIVATLLPIPLVLLDPTLSVSVKIMVILVPAAIQGMLGYVVQPRLMGKSLNLNPVAILLALVLFGQMWGIPGMFLATPILAVIKILLDHSDYMRPLGGMLSDPEK